MRVGDPPGLWAELGFRVEDDSVAVSGVRLLLGAHDPGLHDWAFGEPAPHAPPHPNGVAAIDHVVLFTPDLDATVDRLSDEGHDLRRIREAGKGVRQAFFRLGDVILEVVGPTDGDERLWGITFTVHDLDATVAFLGDKVRPPKEAVQPGRRIATLDTAAGSTVPLAFMSPHIR
jgi:catechol 2,3-dioxygenase-like lactoylglutathione lyase family enzyme